MQKSSESLKELLAALVNLQAGDPRPKNTEKARLRKYSYEYSPLSEIIGAVRPLMKENGLGFSQEAELVDEGRTVAVTTMLFHSSGEWLELAPMKIPVDYSNKSVNAAQAAGIAITYGRRYSLTAALGISSEDDTDGKVPEKAARIGQAGSEFGRTARQSETAEAGDNDALPAGSHPGAESGSGEFQARMLRVKRLAGLDRMAGENAHQLSQDDYNFLGQEIRGLGWESIEDLTEEEFNGAMTLLEQKIRRDKTVLLKGAN